MGARLGLLPAGSHHPSFRTDLAGNWQMVTMPDGSDAWLPAQALDRILAPVVPPSDPGRAVVVIDPGHGGADGGATGPAGLREKLASTTTGTETYYQCGYEQTADVQAESKRLACLLQAAELTSIGQFNQDCGGCCPPFDRGVIGRLASTQNPRDYYYVLRATFIPAVIVESLFLSNTKEEACLRRPEVQEALADALFPGITAYQGQSGRCSPKGPYYGL